ncbi:uncharacterized protein Nmag_3516 [Natrialba magadii ATCC 43099]|uniref:Uncharacterized protein n=2 Tax=Natrialba magadii (strain ATCC 43099 / DSM 3394 / CCM 3739 / CIP 104546 / IAM 13178 / JCM 8861 / NBRC 102185 / NCIMB 2190 / MS3) TaxID=547559 RepID=D3STX7_NATMM|nr:hypothetical protein [Natrialba magadii]ADD07066.1 uncharacterized protein Nmag_3516 [Natrialba magadii ATCC 43099]
MARSASSLSPVHWLAIALAAVSALVHLILGVSFLPHWMGVAFLAATAGFLLGIALVIRNYRRRLVYLLGIPFTAGQIVLWYIVNEPTALADLSAAETVDKIAQTLLIALLLILLARRD